MNLEGIAHVRNSLCRNVFDYYSSTEASLAAFTAYGPGANTPGATVVPWAKLEIVDEAGRQLPAGAEGIVRVRTPALMENLKAAGPDRISSVRDDWFYPGDIGSLDDEGAFYLSGRNSDVINRGGIKVSGTLVEEIVRSFPKIREAAACGITGPSGLEELWIGVVADEPIDVEQIKMRLSEHTDIRIAPDEIILLDEIPRGELGKVQTPRLKELLLELKRSG
jgi:acyl-coenzyme A synthetase/AMP-(fatty) acid ligase